MGIDLDLAVEVDTLNQEVVFWPVDDRGYLDKYAATKDGVETSDPDRLYRYGLAFGEITVEGLAEAVSFVLSHEQHQKKS